LTTELTRPLRRTAILFWVVAGLFVIQMAWWIIFQLWHGRDDLAYRERALRSEPSVALSRWRAQVSDWQNTIRDAWEPLGQVSKSALGLDTLDWWHTVYLETADSLRMIAHSHATTRPLGCFTVPLGSHHGSIVVLVDASALDGLLSREFPDVIAAPRRNTTAPPGEAVSLEDLTLDPAALDRVLDERRGRLRMFIGEGAFFVVLIVVGAIAIHRALRRGAEFERRQQNFLAAVTHELKAPLASIRLFTETLSTRELPEDRRRDVLNKITHDIERLEDLINDALNAGVFSRQSFHPSLERLDLSEQLESYVEMHRHRAERAGSQIDADIAPDVIVMADRVHLRRAIGAVIENAIKYSGSDAKGQPIHVTLKAEGEEAIVTVADHGIGLTPEDQKRVFERFYRAGDEMTRRVTGSGLGLYLSREIIIAHKGRIALCSDGPGQGTTVEIRLPLVTRAKSS
jgi:signal transduction histidine kinase